MPELYLNVIDFQTGLPKLFDHDWVMDNGIQYVYQQQGGLASITAKLAVPWEQTPISTGDFLEVWATGEDVPRARGIVMIPERNLTTKESFSLTAYGRMVDMDKTLLYQVFLQPDGSNQDLAVYARLAYDAYVARKSAATGYKPEFVQNIQPSGINLQQLTCAPATARAAMDTLYNTSSGNVVWGWKIDPDTGNDSFYFLPRKSTVGRQFFVGDSVQALTSPEEADQLVNAVLLVGGGATYPNLVTNASFEQPTNPSSTSGGILQNGSFEAPDPPTDPENENDGYSDNAEYWTLSSSASRNWYDPDSNHNTSARTGTYYLLLDGVVSIPGLPTDASTYTGQSISELSGIYGSGDWAYQDVSIPEGASVSDGDPFNVIATFYSSQESGATPLSNGYLVILGMSGTPGSGGASSGTPTGEYAILPITPPSTAWVGGGASSIVGGINYQLLATFKDSSTTFLRYYVAVTQTQGAEHGLCLDDCTLAVIGAVGQYGWGTHAENPGNGVAQNITSIWACADRPWDGAYFVRATTQCDTGDAVYLCPAGESNVPGANWDSTYHFVPSPQQHLVCAFRVRMAPGSGAGLVRAEYREWNASGQENQVDQGPNVTIPPDGSWYAVWIDPTAHGDAAKAMFQIAFVNDETYDIDGVSVRDASSAEGALLTSLTSPTNDSSQQSGATALYLRGTNFEQYVDVTTPAVAAGLSTEAASSITTWGRREATLNNNQIVDWTADTVTIMQAFFNRAAVLLRRPSATLVNVWDEQPLPSDATQVQISGTGADIDPQWVSNATYTYQKGILLITLEMSDERPTIAKILLATAGAGSASSSVSAPSVGAPAGAGQTSGSGSPAPAASFQADKFTVSGATYTLTQAWDGDYFALFGDGIEQDEANYSVSGTTLTIAGGVTLANWATIRVKYSYQPTES